MKRETAKTQAPAPEWVQIDNVPVQVQKNPYLDKLFNLRFDCGNGISCDVYGCQLRETKTGDVFVSAPSRSYTDKKGQTAYAPQARVSFGKAEDDVLNFLVNGMGL